MYTKMTQIKDDTCIIGTSTSVVITRDLLYRVVTGQLLHNYHRFAMIHI